MKAENFRDFVLNQRLVGDGAMATLLHQMGVPVRTCFEDLCLSSPQLIERIHKQYVDAGADIIQTNTFSGHRAGLERYGLDNKVKEINRAAVRIARKSVGNDAYVFGTVGSILGLQPGLAEMSVEQETVLREQFTEQLVALLDEDVDGLLLETFPDAIELYLAVSTARALTDKPIIAHLSPDAIGVTRDSIPIAEAFRQLRALGADVIGLNCQLGVAGIVKTYEGVSLADGGLYSAYPNAGMLERVENDLLYTAGADYFGKMAEVLYKLGVQLVGGCCGTTPSHVRAIAAARDRVGVSLSDSKKQLNAGKATGDYVLPVIHAAVPVHGGVENIVPPVSPTLVEKTKQQTTVIVELDPPRTLSTEKFMAGAQALADAGADYITLADNSLGHVRVSNMALASLLKRNGIEPLVHVTCRDRNLIGQQSHLMGLHVLGVHHVLLVTGDPSRFGDLPGASSVYDTSSTELATMVQRLNRGIAFSGQHMKESSRFVVGTSFNPNVKNLDKAYERLERKIHAGADYVMTQPLFSAEQIQELASRTEHLDVPIFIGIMPLVSARNAYFLHNEVPGIRIPPAILQRMETADAETAWQEGVAIAKELIDEALQFVSSIYLVTPFLRYTMTEELVRYIRDAEVIKSVATSEKR